MTGYTEMLRELKFDVPRWLKERIIRGMGICVQLRDDEWELNESQIISRLKSSHEHDINYHANELAKANKSFTDLKERTEAEWKVVYFKEQEKARFEHQKSVADHEQGKYLYSEAAKKIEALRQNPEAQKNEVVKGALKFAAQQIYSTIDFDYGDESYMPDVLRKTLTDWKEAQLTTAQWNVDYHTKELAEAKKRLKEAMYYYKSFVKFVNDHEKDLR